VAVADSSNRSPVGVGIVGMGTVGTGVARVLQQHGDRLARRAGRPLVLRRVVVRRIGRPRDLPLAEGVLTDQLQTILDDPEIHIAAHLVGGIHPAREILLELLRAGKDVVTANKALLCECGDELFTCARELGRTIAFEAAVAGGIPIIATVGQCLAANQIVSISAILNGTSNYILTQMNRENWDYQRALRRAQELGFAEEDPTLDVDGSDAAQKLIILTRLAFGVRVSLAQVHRQGIDRLDLSDLRFANELGFTVKLLAVSQLVGEQLEMFVQPCLVRKQTPLAEVQGAYNAIGLVGDVVGETWFSGPGAGQMPTASAVVADLIDLARGEIGAPFSVPVAELEAMPRAETGHRLGRSYIRFMVADRPGVLAEITAALRDAGVSIESLIQKGRNEEGGEVLVAMVTHEGPEAAVAKALRLLEGSASLTAPPLVMHILGA